MESSRSSKRRRMISFSSHVSSPRRPDLPAIFESLNDDTLTTVLEFVGNKSYKSFGGLNKHCIEVYLNTPGMTKETFLYGYAPLSVIIDKIERADPLFFYRQVFERVGKGVLLYNRRDIFKWALQERNNKLLRGICNVAGKEGRTDLLNKVLNNIDDEYDKRYIFEEVDQYAVKSGKLNMLKWFETKGLCINGDRCAREAARHGHLHILQWLHEEKGLELFKGLYIDAIHGHFHVMKWLREQGFPWSVYTFQDAAIEGNLDVLQWLHYEGCPWNRRWRVREGNLKPEVVEWLRANGYSGRLY